jgi:hypothetical protein
MGWDGQTGATWDGRRDNTILDSRVYATEKKGSW